MTLTTAPEPTPHQAEHTLQQALAWRDRGLALFLDGLLHSDRLQEHQRPEHLEQAEHLLARMVSLCESDTYSPQAFIVLMRSLCGPWRRMPDLLLGGM